MIDEDSYLCLNCFEEEDPERVTGDSGSSSTARDISTDTATTMVSATDADAE